MIKLYKQHKQLTTLILSLEKLLEQEESDDNDLNDQLQKLVENGRRALESKPFLTEEQRKELETENMKKFL